jgi:hypothetical protein
MTPLQREQFHILAALVRDLRAEVAQRVREHEDISVAEPMLATPSSALRPDRFGPDHEWEAAS